MNNPENHVCPLCTGSDIAPYHCDKVREYLQCRCCDLVFVPPAHHLSAEAEKACYDMHDNQPDDPGYRRFLSRLFDPLNQRLKAGSLGLDFGCGPGPTLSKMFEEAGHTVAIYDPYYAPDKSVLRQGYDFITLSEVAEHLAAPGIELDQLWQCIVPGGCLAIMTKRVRDQKSFASWHYITDPTHICYFSEASFSWLSSHWSQQGTPATLLLAGADVALFIKGET